jgi:hypothetical protein
MRRLMVAVFLVAVDFAILRGMSDTSQDIGVAFVTLPMANALILVAARVRSGNRWSPFWIGFVVVGWFMVASFGYLSWSHGAKFFRAANSVYPWITIKNIYVQWVYLFSIDFIVYTPPQVLVAWFGGRMAARYLPGGRWGWAESPPRWQAVAEGTNGILHPKEE